MFQPHRPQAFGIRGIEMNAILTFLQNNWARLGLQRFGSASRLSCVVATPRFRASSHLIFFVLTDDDAEPKLVVKVPRLIGDHARLDREAANLRAAQHARAGGFDSIPQVLAYEDYCHHRLLVETALLGRPMSPAVVRRQTDWCIEKTLAWLLDFHGATLVHGNHTADWFERLAVSPLHQLKAMLPPAAAEECLIDETLHLIECLRGRAIRLVMEHGDLSHPNLMLSHADGVGVVDWELAEPQGLPALDLFFFLSYIAFARQRARKNTEYLNAFQQVFFVPQAWAAPYITRYADRMELPRELLAPLFVLCWSRYVAGLVMRLYQVDTAKQRLAEETVAWLRSNRYYLLWRYAVENVSKLQLANK
jgi:aminoglycoside phosphotransferase